MIDVRCWQPRNHDAHDWSGKGGDADFTLHHCDGRPFTRRAVSPDAPSRPETPTTPAPDQQDGAGACTYCGASVDVWPRRDCEQPEEHVSAVYECDCGEAVTITEAIEHPAKHRRCNLIGDREAGYVSTVAFLLFVIVGSLVFLAVLKGAQPVVCWMNGDALAYCDGSQAVTR